MNIFEKILSFLQFEMTEPTPYGWFHLMWIAIVIAVTVFLCVKFKNCDDKIFRRITLIVWIVIVVLEIYKQFSFSFENNNGVGEWDYSWYSFPFQFCSTPLYLLPIVVFMKDGKVRDSVIAFLMTYAFFGGIAAFILPSDLFIEEAMINIQTMVHHGSQIVIGIFYYVVYRKKINLTFILKGFFTFAVMIFIALTLNIVFYHAFIKEIDETFNMFYISPYFENTMPVLGFFYERVNNILFIVLYFICFSFISIAIYYIMKGIDKLCCIIKARL